MQNKIPRDLVTVELKTNEDKVDERITGSHCRVKYNRCLIYSAFAEKEKKKKGYRKSSHFSALLSDRNTFVLDYNPEITRRYEDPDLPKV